MQDIQQEFQDLFPESKINEPLARYTTFKIGGPASLFHKLKDPQDLPKLIEFTQKHKLPYLVIGAGSNVFFQDEGFHGLIIRVETQNIATKNTEITVDAGLQISKLVKFSVENDLQGLEAWGGLPGTVGGAVRGNAGCHGLEIKDVLKKATVFDPKTLKFQEKSADFFNFDYRHSILKESSEILINATFELQTREITHEKQQELIKESQHFRLTKQPFGLTTGSFFKNPTTDRSAGYLIDQAGLKGKSIGDAQVSDLHANFLINKGSSTSEEMQALVTLIKREVKAKFDIDLNEEVQVIPPNGFPLR